MTTEVLPGVRKRADTLSLFLYGLAVLLGLGALPAGIQTPAQLGGIQVQQFELLLVAASLPILGDIWRFLRQHTGILVFAITIATALPLSLLTDNPTQPALTDTRGLAVLVLATVLTGTLASKPGALPGILFALKWTLIVSAVLIVVASVTGLRLEGRVEDAGLYLSSGTLQTSSATRLLVPTSHLATGVLSASAACLLFGIKRFRSLAPWLLSSFTIAALSFSRNVILGVAAALVCALVLRGARGLKRATPLLALAALITTIGALAIAVVEPAWDPNNWFGRIMIGFETRVLGGLTGEALSTDTSVLYRDREMQFGVTAVLNSPLLGNGFGYAYHPGSGDVGTFWRDQAPYYSHNFYLWLAIKMGAIGLITFTGFVVSCVAGTYDRTLRVAATVGGVSLLAVCFVAPLPLESYSALTLALPLGIAAAFRNYERSTS